MHQIQTRHGRKLKDELQKDFTELNIRCNYIEIPKRYKDINEWYCNIQKETFCDKLEESTFNKYKTRTLNYYLGTYFDDIKNYCTYPIKKTGFKNLDIYLDGGIRQGLYVIGAIPSLRKNNVCFTTCRQHSKRQQQSYYIQFRARTF